MKRFGRAIVVTSCFLLLGIVISLVPQKSVTAGPAATSVMVTNAATNPVPVKDVDQPARQPFQQETCNFVGTNPALTCKAQG